MFVYTLLACNHAETRSVRFALLYLVPALVNYDSQESKNGEDDGGEFSLFQTSSLLFFIVQLVKSYVGERCWRIFLELNSNGLYPRLEKQKAIIVLCSRPKNVKLGNFTWWPFNDVRKCTKKYPARAELFF